MKVTIDAEYDFEYVKRTAMWGETKAKALASDAVTPLSIRGLSGAD